MKITPRPFQMVAISAILDALKSRARRALVVMATGLGKTLTVAFTAKKFRAKRILFLVHNNFILNHAVDQFCLVFDKKKTNMVKYNGWFKGDAQHADIVFATWQTMGKRIKKWKRNHFDLIIVDEAHHTGADTYRPVVDYFTGPRLAITATPDRTDDTDIRDVFGKPVVNISLEEAIARGELPRVEYHVVTDESLDNKALQKIAAEIKAGKKRFTMAEVNRRIFIKKRDVEITRIINSYDKKALVFCSSIAHAERMKKTLKRSRTFHSSTATSQARTWKRNQETLDALEKGDILRVCAVNAFNEGVNVPSIGLVAFCRVTEALTIFRQQLGRGLRRGKKKLIALDFVGNLERIQRVIELMNRISDLHEKFTSKGDREREAYVRKPFEVSGKGFEFTFSDEVVDLMKVLEHCEREFYPTWQEAGEAAQKLGIDSVGSYKLRYREDPRLPSDPNKVYPDFPGFTLFLARFYETWQEAAKVAKKLNIHSWILYKRLRIKDPRLPCHPNTFYSDFPGWNVFLGKKSKKFYSTWQKASKVAIRKKIKNYMDYIENYSSDSCLPSSPHRFYSDFPGWNVFLGKKSKKFYSTWQKASKVAIRKKATSIKDYKKKCASDSRMHSNPNLYYPDFPGWYVFLGKKVSKIYSTWRKASKGARRAKITSSTLYPQMRKLDPMLPCTPHKYYADFPGWDVFLGTEFYTTWQQAGKAAIKKKIKSSVDYPAKYSADPRLPSNPSRVYKDFPGWKKFLGKK